MLEETFRNFFLRLWFGEIVKSDKANALMLHIARLEEDVAKGGEYAKNLLSIAADPLRSQMARHFEDETRHARVVRALIVSLGYEHEHVPQGINYMWHFVNILDEYKDKRTLDPVIEFLLISNILEKRLFLSLRAWRLAIARHRPDLKVVRDILHALEKDEVGHITYPESILRLHDLTLQRRFYEHLALKARKRWLLVLLPELKKRVSGLRFSVLAFFLNIYAKI